MHASATARIKTSCRAAMTSNGVSEHLRLSGVSIAYGHARSCMSGMTSMSPMGLSLIPAVDPKALLEELEDGRR